MADSALQMVEAEPGVLGANVIEALPVTLAEVRAVVGDVHALCGGVGMVENCETTAATAEFMYAFASAWQAPSAERMR